MKLIIGTSWCNDINFNNMEKSAYTRNWKVEVEEKE